MEQVEARPVRRGWLVVEYLLVFYGLVAALPAILGLWAVAAVLTVAGVSGYRWSTTPSGLPARRATMLGSQLETVTTLQQRTAGSSQSRCR